MRKINSFLILAVLALLAAGCSSAKNATGLKVSKKNLSGLWTVSDISVQMPENFQVTDVFDEAPYTAFEGSKWNLIRNGKGSYTLENGMSREIYWSLSGSGDDTQLQFKKLMGEKARNVDTGYRLRIDNVTPNSFTATSVVNTGGNTGQIVYTFTK